MEETKLHSCSKHTEYCSGGWHTPGNIPVIHISSSCQAIFFGAGPRWQNPPSPKPPKSLGLHHSGPRVHSRSRSLISDRRGAERGLLRFCPAAPSDWPSSSLGVATCSCFKCIFIVECQANCAPSTLACSRIHSAPCSASQTVERSTQEGRETGMGVGCDRRSEACEMCACGYTYRKTKLPRDANTDPTAKCTPCVRRQSLELGATALAAELRGIRSHFCQCRRPRHSSLQVHLA